MRAVIKGDPARGAGYAILEILGISAVEEPVIRIRRIEDGRSLAPDGWHTGDFAIPPGRWEAKDSEIRLWLGPNVVDELDTGSEYDLELPGIGSCALFLERVEQSAIRNESGNRLIPPAEILEAPQGQPAYAQIVDEGVEPTPEVNGRGDMPAGVAAGLERNIVDKQPRRRGCLVAVILGAIIWLAVAWFLWHAAIRTPPAADDGKPFELIPSQDDSGST